MTTKRGAAEVSVHVWSDMGCFTQAQYGVERFTWPVITPTAAQFLLGAIYNKRYEFTWRVKRIEVLSPLQQTRFKMNEITATASGNAPIYVSKERTQRTLPVVINPDYLITAEVVLNPKCKLSSNNVRKHVAQFNKRVKNGQCFFRPYMGMRDFPADFEPVPRKKLKPIAVDMDLDGMPIKVQYSTTDEPTRFFHAKMKQGVIDIPQGV